MFSEFQYTVDDIPEELHWMLPTVPLVLPKNKIIHVYIHLNENEK